MAAEWMAAGSCIVAPLFRVIERILFRLALTELWKNLVLESTPSSNEYGTSVCRSSLHLYCIGSTSLELIAPKPSVPHPQAYGQVLYESKEAYLGPQ